MTLSLLVPLRLWLEARLRAPLANRPLLEPAPPPPDPPWQYQPIPLRAATSTRQAEPYLRIVPTEEIPT